MSYAPTYPTPEEFRVLLDSRPLQSIVQEHLFHGIPYAFREDPKAMDLLRNHLARHLGICESDIVVVGSARIGFSISEDNYSRRFSARSDIDVLCVCDHLFDQFWSGILDWHNPRRAGIPREETDWAAERRKNIYWGWIDPGKIDFSALLFPELLRPVRTLATQWFDAFQGLSLHPEFAGRDVNGRLYRTWRHALLYQTYALARVRAALSGSGQEAPQ